MVRRTAHGLDQSIEFRKRMLRTAEQERQRWSTLLPDPKRTGPITGTSWSNLGPTKANKLVNGVTLHVTDSGRVRTIIVDGSTIYLATAGGVWKRTDGVWTPITETIGTLSCGSLAMDPANHDVLYLGLGDPSTRGEAQEQSWVSIACAASTRRRAHRHDVGDA
jgi:hypothetical protein